MADLKISQLTGATTPLTGTEVLPVVQSGSTKKVAVSDLTAGRAVAAKSFTSSDLTSGRIPFATTNGLLTDNPFLAWDNVNSFLGVGISPNYRLHVARSSAGIIAAFRATDVSAAANVIIVGNSQGDLIASSTTTGNGLIYADSGKTLAFGANGSTAARLTISTAGDVTANTGNVIIGTAGKGIDFSANTGQPGMTSELLNWYETGTWTPADASGAGLTISVTAGTTPKYTRIGNIVFFTADISYPSTADTNIARLSLPVPTSATNPLGTGAIGFRSDSNFSVIAVYPTGTAIIGPLNTFQTNANLSGVRIIYSATYFAA